jgi:spermidine synthase
MKARKAPAAGVALRPLALVVSLSGATALVYQSLWMRSLGLVFGNTTDAVAVVLATFMGGLALGGLAAARWPAARPLRAYAWVEIGIGVAALLTWPLLKALPAAYAALAALVPLEGMADVAGRAVFAAAVLLPPTVLLGATVPLVVEHRTRGGADLRKALARLYLVNTVGAAAGVALGAFLLVPLLGLSGTLACAALVNLGIGVAARHWSEQEAPAEGAAEPLPPGAEGPRLRTLFATLAFASGAFSFGMEILWTRSLVLVIGSSIYAFNLVLLAVLTGIVGGTALYERLRPRIARPQTWLGGLFLAATAAALCGVLVLGALPDAYLALMRALPVTFAWHLAAGFALCLAAMLPATVLLGITFPLLLHLAETDRAQRATGLLYAWNTAGALVGALAADLVLVGALGLERSFLALATLLVVGGTGALVLARGSPVWARAAAAVAAAIVVLALTTSWQPWDPLRMTAGVYKYGLEWRERPGFRLSLLAAERRILFYEEGREAVVAVAERPGTGRRYLSVNGKTDAGSGAEDVLTQKFIAHVPLLLHPAPRNVLVVGWGAGATAASASLHPVRRLECVEIEPATWRAAPWFADLSGRVRGDPRFHMVFRDGRNHLLRSPARWDVVISEPSNPWIAGVSNLFTLEFYETVRSRLKPGGLFGQWFHYYNFEPRDVKVELRTFARAFPHVSVWVVPPVPGAEGNTLTADLLLVGSQEAHALEWERLRRAFAGGAVAEDLRSTRVLEDEAAVLAAWAMDREGVERYAEDRRAFPNGTPLNTDDRPWIEFAAPRRNVQPPSEVARLARAQYDELAEVAADAMPPLWNGPVAAADVAALYRSLADRHAEAARPRRAVRSLERALGADPTSAATLARLGELLVSGGDVREGERRLREAARLDPGAAEVWERLGGIYLDGRDYTRAEEAHRALVRLRPADVSARLRLGAVLARRGRWSEARVALLDARRLDGAAPIDPGLMEYVDRQVGRR